MLTTVQSLGVLQKSKLPKNNTVAQVLGKQVLRSGTSVDANYRKASRGWSKAEFISKIGDCLKEIEESEYWLELLVDVVAFLNHKCPICSTKPAKSSPFSRRLIRVLKAKVYEKISRTVQVSSFTPVSAFNI